VSIGQFLDSVEDFLKHKGGTAPFSIIGLVHHVPRPPNFPQDVSLRQLCESDSRFKFSADNPKKVLEISLTAEVQVIARSSSSSFSKKIFLHE
jgi:hypothetical protein